MVLIGGIECWWW